MLSSGTFMDYDDNDESLSSSFQPIIGYCWAKDAFQVIDTSFSQANLIQLGSRPYASGRSIMYIISVIETIRWLSFTYEYLYLVLYDKRYLKHIYNVNIYSE